MDVVGGSSMLSPRSFFLHAYISDTYLPIRFSLHLFATKMGRRNVQTFGGEVLVQFLAEEWTLYQPEGQITYALPNFQTLRRPW